MVCLECVYFCCVFCVCFGLDFCLIFGFFFGNVGLGFVGGKWFVDGFFRIGILRVGDVNFLCLGWIICGFFFVFISL